MKKILFAASMLIFSTSGCTQGNPAHNTTDANKSQAAASISKFAVKAQPTAAPGLKPEGIPSNSKLKEHEERQSEIKPKFDDAPEFKDVLPGQVTVIFKDSYKVRKEKIKGSKKVKGKDSLVASDINLLLQQYDVQELGDFSGGATEQEIDEDELVAEGYWGTDIPHLMSEFVLTFPAESDTKLIAKTLKKHPAVLTAYRTPRLTPGATTLRRTNFGTEKNTVFPSTMSNKDPIFNYAEDPSSNPSSPGWYWFNRERIFDAWSLIGTARPPVSVVDTGFDTRTGDDQPVYLTGQAFDASGNPTGTTVSEPTISGYNPNGSPIYAHSSHGSSVASIIGSPSNNGKGLAGVVPGTPIYPIRIVGTPQSIAAGIRYSYDSTNSWVTNVSFQADGKPITYDVTVRDAIFYATSRKQFVVIIAGNYYHNLNIDAPISDGGAFIVGGTEESGRNWRQFGGMPGETAGSSYGAIVDMAACARDIAYTDYDPSTNIAYINAGSGTSFAAPQVAAVAALVQSYVSQKNGSTPTTAQIADILWGSATIMSSWNGEKMGHRLSSYTSEPASIRQLDMANAIVMANNCNKNPIVRVFNTDDLVWACADFLWNYRFADQNYSDDGIYDLSMAGLGTANTIDLATYNFSDARSHGYQIWRNGFVDAESIAGVSVKKNAAGNILYYTAGEDNGATDAGWHYVYSYPAIR